MEYYVYILKNSQGRLYKGQTNNLERRIYDHQFDRWKDYRLIFAQVCENRSEAMELERFFKTGLGREIIQEFFIGPIV